MLASCLKPFTNRPEPVAILNSVHEICVNSLSKGKHSPLRPRLIVSSNDQLSPGQLARRSSTITSFCFIATRGSTCIPDVRSSAGRESFEQVCWIEHSFLTESLRREAIEAIFHSAFGCCILLFGRYWKGSWRSNYGPHFIHVRVLLRPGFAT